MIESIITDYLQQNRRLVLPELGAFLKKDSGDIVFAPFLNKNDGILSGLVSQNYGTSATEADEIIFQYVDKIRSGIAANGLFLVHPLGSLKKDPNGLLFLDTKDLNPAMNRVAAAEEAVKVPVSVPQQIVPEEVVQVEIEVRPTPDPVQAEAPKPEPFIAPQPVKRIIPVVEPQYQEEVKTLADTLAENAETPKTLNDLIREKQEEQQEQPVSRPQPTQSTRPSQPVSPKAPAPQEQRRPVSPARPNSRKTEPVPQRSNPAKAEPKKRKGDIILVLAVIIAIAAIVAMIYAYAIDLPLFNLQ